MKALIYFMLAVMMFAVGAVFMKEWQAPQLRSCEAYREDAERFRFMLRDFDPEDQKGMRKEIDTEMAMQAALEQAP